MAALARTVANSLLHQTHFLPDPPFPAFFQKSLFILAFLSSLFSSEIHAFLKNEALKNPRFFRLLAPF